MLVDDELDDLISAADPVLADAVPSGPRREAIWASAVGASKTLQVGRGVPRRWWLGAAAAAVATLTVGATVLVDFGGDGPSVKAAILEAASNLGDVRSLEATVVSAHASGPTPPGDLTLDDTSPVTVRFSGRSAELVLGPVADGGGTSVIVDGYEYQTANGVTTRRPLDYDEWPGNYASATLAVLQILTEAASPQETGSERVSGLEADRFDIEMSSSAAAALGRLSAEDLAWFELEYPDEVDRVSVWVADELIVKIEVHSAYEVDDDNGDIYQASLTRTTFSNFNADFTIEAPPGPYVEALPEG